MEALVGQFLGSADGASLLSQLGAQGLAPQQAQAAVQATAEGVVEHAPRAGLDLGALLGGGGLGALAGALGGGGSGLGGMLGGLTGGGAAAPGGGGSSLGGLLGGLTGGGAAAPGAAPDGGGMVAMLATPVAQFVAQKTGLAPALAQTVVSAVLPKLLALVQK